jgi:pimeloyl-ACP methyl ester carboxylesterase
MADSTLAPHTILVHGLARSWYDMYLLARRLRRLLPGTTVHLFDYQSRKCSLSELAVRLSDFVADVSRGQPVSFVGHSMGGIVVRALDLRGSTAAPLHRLVTLGSPHGGAAIARMLNRYRACRAVFGPALEELSVLNMDLEPKQLEIGNVVGGTGSRWGFFPLFGEDNDGVVLVREARQVRAKEIHTVCALHAYMPFSSRIAGLCASFLDTGSFRAEGAECSNPRRY